MSDIIRLLPDHVANQIAAGEVIQRPASAVKELLENAIDAKASQIKLIVKDAGKTLIQVIDNGIGMSPTDARLAFERHATSKIREAEDLFSLQTKGFRGEALASIAAVSQVEVITAQEGDELGTELNLQANQVVSQQACVAVKGTSISMKNLFYNIPARRKFLKSDSVEMRYIIDEFTRVALAHPDIHFILYNKDTEMFNLPPTHLRQRILHIFGAKMDERLVPVKEETELVKISGFVCRSSTKKHKSHQFFIINHRFIKDRYLHHAVNSAFEGLLKEGVQPEYFLFLEMNPKDIDINIHPTKTEIKFENEQVIYALLRTAVKHSLGQFNVMPPIDFSISERLDLPYAYKDKTPKMPTFSVDPTFNPFKQGQENQKVRVHSPQPSYPKKAAPQWESLYTGVPSKMNDFEPTQALSTPAELPFAQEDSPNLPPVKPTILHWAKKYLVTHVKDRLLVIHPARAHQRVVYEKLLNQQRLHGATQQLLFPLEFDFSPAEAASLQALLPILEPMGFIFETQQATVRLLSLPALLKESQAREVIADLLAQHMHGFPSTGDELSKQVAKRLAYRLSIVQGQVLLPQEQELLVCELFSCSDPERSPSGKKIYYELPIKEIDLLLSVKA